METKMKKDDLIVALTAKKRIAADLDRKATADYTARRKSAIAARRAWFREMAKADDDTVAKWNTYNGNRTNPIPEVPGCPYSLLGMVEKAVSRLSMDYRKTITLDADHLRLLSLGEKQSETICESLS